VLRNRKDFGINAKNKGADLKRLHSDINEYK
jgi:hypothetical protein